MSTRREFLRLSATAVLAGSLPVRTPAADMRPAGKAGRDAWCDWAGRLATPVLDALARRRLKAEMPVEAHPSAKDRPQFTHLEALGRLLEGLAPWLELGEDNTPEGKVRGHFIRLARAAIDAATDPASPDFLNFSRGRQPLVDAAFLAQALLRAPRELWQKTDSRVRRNVINALVSSRPIPAGENNWKLFATMIEAFLHQAGEKRDDARLLEGLTKHRAWYVGDGIYGDGPEFHWDYYNSFVIQPMLVESLAVVRGESAELQAFHDLAARRLTRWAEIQERLIAPDGSYPAIGRSIAYRCGAFQSLALAALRHALPETVAPAQARVALTAVIRRTLEAPGTWDAHGWLNIGLAGHQPALGEAYISTGSLYLCSAALLPLGLPAEDPFWSAPDAPTSWQKAWGGENLPADHALREKK